ncbi:MAG: hypothetical protein GX558_04240, partial [Clostridiales bacterium]|nr:hypothetical protein [Clostridiales bacterium]
QVFAQFSSDMDASTQEKLHYGELLTEVLRQPNNAPLPMSTQVALLYVVTRALLPYSAGMALIRRFKVEFPAYLAESYPHVVSALAEGGQLTDAVERDLQGAVAGWLERAREAQP